MVWKLKVKVTIFISWIGVKLVCGAQCSLFCCSRACCHYFESFALLATQHPFYSIWEPLLDTESTRCPRSTWFLLRTARSLTRCYSWSADHRPLWAILPPDGPKDCCKGCTGCWILMCRYLLVRWLFHLNCKLYLLTEGLIFCGRCWKNHCGLWKEGAFCAQSCVYSKRMTLTSLRCCFCHDWVDS